MGPAHHQDFFRLISHFQALFVKPMSFRAAASILRTPATFFAVTMLWMSHAHAALPVLGDLDGDGRVTVLDLTRLQMHVNRTSPLPEELQLVADINLDGLADEADVTGIADIILAIRSPQEVPPPFIVTTSPGLGEGNVSLTRETIIRFSQPLAPTNSITTNTLYAAFGGRRILSRVEFASDRRSLTLFYLENLPASARVRVTIDGDVLAGVLGQKLDVDGDGIEGGLGYLEFDTASVTPVLGTAIIGRVFASELVPDPANLTNSVNVPLAGVTVTVDGAEETLRAVTDANGFFSLSPCPAGRFFVHVDGRTVRNPAAGIRYPDLAYYPYVGKAWEAVAGYTNNLAGGNGVIYLPLIQQGSLRPVSLTSNTVVTFPPGVVASNPVLSGVSITVPAGSLFSENGQRGGQVGIAPVAPDRLPEPLPPGLNLPLVITVQTDGPQNFSEPVPVCFPNLPNPRTGQPLPPGAKSALWSFNHDTGQWEIQGPMTVTSDGRMVCTDPGVGIRQPGWHGQDPATQGGGGDDQGDWSPDPNPNEKGESPPAGFAAPECGSPEPANPTDPVHLSTGEFYHAEEDMRIKGVGMDFVWARKFQSKRVLDSGPLGPRWTHSYEIRLKVDYSTQIRSRNGQICDECKKRVLPFIASRSRSGGVGVGGVAIGDLCSIRHKFIRSVSIVDGNGRRDEFFADGEDAYRSRGLDRELRQADDDTWVLTFQNGGKWVFSRLVDYQITRIEDRHGNRLEFDYEPYTPAGVANHRLVRIRDTLGRPVVIRYNEDNLVETVTDFTGRSIRYEYYAAGERGGAVGLLKAVTNPAVTDHVGGNGFPAGKRRTYTYLIVTNALTRTLATRDLVGCPSRREYSEDFIGISSITDGRNNDPGDPRYQKGAYLTNYYAPDGLSAGTEFVVVPPGFHARSGWVEVSRLRVTRQSWGGQDLHLSYQQFGTQGTYRGVPVLKTGGHLLTTVRDRNGNVKEYLYDRYNQALELREYAGRAPREAGVTVGANRPAHPLRPSDHGGIRTRYNYDGNFRQSGIVRPNGNRVEYTYRGGSGRSAGNLLAVTHLPGEHQPSGDQASLVRTYAYDSDFSPCCGFNFATNSTDARGFAIQSRYDRNGNLTNRVFPIPGVVEDFTYNERGQLTERIHPPNGSGHRRVDRYVYYTSGPQNGYLRLAIIDATGAAMTNVFEYDLRGNVTRWIDPNGKDTRYIVNELDQVVRQISREVTDGSGIRYQKDYHYDANNNLTRVEVQNVGDDGVVQPNSHFTTTFEYDILNYVTRKTEEVEDGRSIVTEYAYDGNRNLIEIRKGEATSGRQPANVVRFEYDERDLLFREIRAPGTPDQSSTQYDYDGNRNLIRISQGLEGEPRITEFTYDGFDRLVAVRDPMGNESLFNYDPNGNLVRRRVNGEVVDVVGDSGNLPLSDVRYQYDPLNRLIRQDRDLFDTATQTAIGPGVAATRIEYSGTSQIIRMINANGHTNTISYDSANRRQTLTDSAGNNIILSYDRNSNITRVTEVEKSDLGDPDEVFTTWFEYDNLNRLTATVDNVSTTNRFAYDSRGNRTLHINGRGNAIRHTYDGLSRPLDIIRFMTATGEGTGAVTGTITTRQTWDDSSRLVSQTDDNGNATVYTYDALDRRIATTYADGTVHQTAFDVHDNPVRTLDANGNQVTNRFDALNRLVRRDIAVGPGVSDDTTFENYRYDGQSRLVWAEDNDSTAQMDYDSLSRMLRDIQNGTVVASTYDPVGNMTALHYPSGRVVTNTYDGLNRLKTVADAEGLIARYDYAGPRRVKRRDYGNGTRMTYEYDGVAGVPNPPGDFGVRQVIRTTHSNIATGTPFDDRVYRWDRAGNKTVHNELHAGGSSRTYSYDSVDRLVRSVKTPSSGPVEDIRYLLDGVGNRTQVIGGPDAGDYTMLSVGPEPADRQMNQYTTTPFGTETHDRNGNLVANNAGTPNERTLVYDYRNRLVGVVARDVGVTVRYAYDPLGRRSGKRVAGNEKAELEFVHHGWRVIEESDTTINSSTWYAHGNYLDEVLLMNRDGRRHVYHTDDMFSVVVVGAWEGAFFERADYSDFGYPIQAHNGKLWASSGNRHSFTGREFEQEVGLAFVRNRFKEPETGRFLQTDPLGIWGDGVNLGNGKTYAGNSPGRYADPLGLQCRDGGADSDDQMVCPDGPNSCFRNPFYVPEGGGQNGPRVIAEIEKIKGNVTVQRNDGRVEALKVGDKVYQGDTIITRDGDRVKWFDFDRNMSKVLAGDSRLYMDGQREGEVRGRSKTSEHLDGMDKQIRKEIHKYDGDPFKVRTPNAADGVRG